MSAEPALSRVLAVGMAVMFFVSNNYCIVKLNTPSVVSKRYLIVGLKNNDLTQAMPLYIWSSNRAVFALVPLGIIAWLISQFQIIPKPFQHPNSLTTMAPFTWNSAL